VVSAPGCGVLCLVWGSFVASVVEAEEAQEAVVGGGSVRSPLVEKGQVELFAESLFVHSNLQ